MRKMCQSLISIQGIPKLNGNSFVDLHRNDSIHNILSKLTFRHDDIAAAFPNLSKLAQTVTVLPITTATVERTFSSMKLIKTRLRNRMSEDTLDNTMRICIEGPM